MTPLATAALDWVHLMQPIDPACRAGKLLVINELREAGRLERTAEGLKWLPVRESVGQGKLF
jgi:hypothetical protein